MAHVLEVIGFVTRDPELRFTPSGQAVANLTVADQSQRFNRDTNQWEQKGDTLFWEVSVWGPLAEKVVEHIHKGSGVTIKGETGIPQVYEGKNRETGESEWRARLTMTAKDVDLNVKLMKGSNNNRNNGGGYQNNSGGGYQNNNSGGNGGGWNNGGGNSNGNSGGWNAPANDPWATNGGNSGGTDEPPF